MRHRARGGGHAPGPRSFRRGYRRADAQPVRRQPVDSQLAREDPRRAVSRRGHARWRVRFHDAAGAGGAAGLVAPGLGAAHARRLAEPAGLRARRRLFHQAQPREHRERGLRDDARAPALEISRVMRGNQTVSSHRACGFAAGSALLPGIGFTKNWFLNATIWSEENKVMAGGTPANPAALAWLDSSHR